MLFRSRSTVREDGAPSLTVDKTIAFASTTKLFAAASASQLLNWVMGFLSISGKSMPISPYERRIAEIASLSNESMGVSNVTFAERSSQIGSRE